MREWTDRQRNAARAFVKHAMPIPQYQTIARLEDAMPPNWRTGFEELFDLLEPPIQETHVGT